VSQKRDEDRRLATLQFAQPGFAIGIPF